MPIRRCRQISTRSAALGGADRFVYVKAHVPVSSGAIAEQAHYTFVDDGLAFEHYRPSRNLRGASAN